LGLTIPSCRLASEIEKNKWKIFRQRLNKKDKKIFDVMMSYPKLYNSAVSNVCRPELIHPFLITIDFKHYKQLET